MELRQLRYFREVVRCGNYRRAAEGLNITQPALSKSIQALETELGVQLLERSVHGVAPSEAGRLLLDHADLIATEVDRISDEFAVLTGGQSGLVRVAGGSSMLRLILPKAAQLFFSEQPTARLLVRQGLLEEILTALEKSEVDLALCTHLPEPFEETVQGDILLEDEIVVVCDEAHPLLAQSAAGLEDLAECRWIVPGASESERQHLETVFDAHDLPPADVVVEAASSPLMARLLKGQSYLSYLPASLMRSDPEFAHLRPLATPVDWPPVHIILARRKRGRLLPAAKRFSEALGSAANSMSTGP